MDTQYVELGDQGKTTDGIAIIYMVPRFPPVEDDTEPTYTMRLRIQAVSFTLAAPLRRTLTNEEHVALSRMLKVWMAKFRDTLMQECEQLRASIENEPNHHCQECEQKEICAQGKAEIKNHTRKQHGCWIPCVPSTVTVPSGEHYPPPPLSLEKLSPPTSVLIERLQEGVRRLSRLVYPCRSEKDAERNSRDATRIASNVLNGKTWDGKE